MDYQIVISSELPSLQSSVQEALEEGWLVWGNIIDFKGQVGQPMIKVETAFERQFYGGSNGGGSNEN